MVTKRDIQLTFDLLGVKPGDVLFIQSAYTAIGGVEGGADALIDAILDLLGPTGTLCMSGMAGWAKPFDADTTPVSVGYLPEVFRRRAGVLRSLHPVHGVTACGRHAAFITSGHENAPTGCGEGTPYTKMRDLGGKIILLGVDMDRNTSLHCIEEFMDSSYLVTLDIPAPTYLPGQEKFTLRKFPPGHRDFKGTTPSLRRAGLLKEAKLGDAVVRCMGVKEMFDWGMKNVAQDPFFFLCENPHCKFCTAARAGGDVPKED